ncbi:ATP-binding protein, partial [Rhodoplanes elegans]
GDGHLISIDVTDSGIGLAKAEIRRLFRPFAQGSDRIAERFGGSGLGLAYVKRLANAMGGDVTVTSALGRGSTFHLTVRLAAAPDGAGE